MENLTLLQQKTLKILKQLEYCCDSAELNNPEKIKRDKFLEITFGDIDFSNLKIPEDLYNIEKYLQNNGVDFHMTTDPNDPPNIDNEHPSRDYISFGEIKGENIQEIKTIIKKLIKRLGPGALAPEEIRERKYFEITEEIEVKNLGIKIQNDGYISYTSKNKNKDKFKINSTDQALIRYLHYRFTEEKRQCVPIDILARELGMAEGYIVNRISFINKGIRALVIKGKTSSNIDDFIKNEQGRGYHLNPRFIIQFAKKKKKGVDITEMQDL